MLPIDQVSGDFWKTKASPQLISTTLFLYLGQNSESLPHYHRLSRQLDVGSRWLKSLEVYLLCQSTSTWAWRTIPPIKRLIFVFNTGVKKLHPYFFAYIIQVIVDQSLRYIFSQFNVSRQLLKWSVELMLGEIGEDEAFFLSFMTRKAIRNFLLIYHL